MSSSVPHLQILTKTVLALFSSVLLLSPSLWGGVVTTSHWSVIAAVRVLHGITQAFEPGHQETGLQREGYRCWQS